MKTWTDARGVEFAVLYDEDGWSYHVPASKLIPWHILDVTEDFWHLTHPISCAMEHCEFNERAQTLELEPGRYYWWRHKGKLVMEPEEAT